MKKYILSIVIALILFTATGCYDKADNIPKLISETVLPDVDMGETGKGFTCTGLSYDETEDIFYVGNVGQGLPSEEGFKQTIVKLSKDGKTNLGEIKLFEAFPEMKNIQGLTIDKSDDTIWFCSFDENKIRHISKTGEDISSIEVLKPTGIAYDTRTDTLWVLTYSELKNIDKDGNIIDSIDVEIEGQDQIFLDEDKNEIFFTAGINYKGDNYVYKVDLSAKKISLVFILKDSFAVEGIYIDGNIMYILNDGYYHSAEVNVNQMNKYDISQIMTYEEFKKLEKNR